MFAGASAGGDARGEADESVSSSPLVTVIVASRNCSHLALALSSIQMQTFENWECLVVDDCSDPSVSTSEVPKDSRFRLVRSAKRLGRSGARNLAASQARGGLLVIQDADDFSSPERLARSIERFEFDDDLVVASGRFISLWNGKWFNGPSWPTEPEVLSSEFSAGRMRLAHCASTIRTDSFHKVGGYDTRLERAEDFHLFCRLSAFGRMANLDQILVAYQHPPREPLSLYVEDYSERVRAKQLLDESRVRGAVPRARAVVRYPAYLAKLLVTRSEMTGGQVPEWAERYRLQILDRGEPRHG